MRLVIFALYLMLTLSLSACDWFDDDDDDNSGGAATVEAVHPAVESTEPAATAEATVVEEVEEEVAAADTSDIEYTDNFHHWNPRSWKGKGSSLVLCPGAPKYDSCEIDGIDLRLHGSRDYGRWIWTHYSKRGLSGNITCRDGDRVVGFRASSKSSIQYGDC